MQRQQALDLSSPVVQRVLRLRALMAQDDMDAETELSSSDAVDNVQIRRSYQWQMWQKSDFSAYAGDAPQHHCKW